MIRALALLLLCQLAGEAVSRGAGLPVPGPVLGLLILFAGLQFSASRQRLSGETIGQTEIGRTADGLLQALALLFVPAGAGVVQHLGLLGEHGLSLVIALIGSTVITLLVTTFVFQAVRRWLESDRTWQ
jgi:holin-like protein